MRAERRESRSLGGRRGIHRAVLFFVVLVMALASAGCGKSGKGASTDSEKAADVELLNGLLAHELTLLDAYAAADDALEGRALAVAGEFRGQGLAHVDAIEKAIRGLGGRTDAEAGSFEPSHPRSRGEALDLLYAEESTALGLAGEAAPRMEEAAPSNLAVALAANHAAHLAVLRQTLGAPLFDAVPAPLETGSVPPPGSPSEEGG